MTITRVVVVDDHPVYRNGVAERVGDEPDIEVVGTAADGESAVTTVEGAGTTVRARLPLAAR